MKKIIFGSGVVAVIIVSSLFFANKMHASIALPACPALLSNYVISFKGQQGTSDVALIGHLNHDGNGNFTGGVTLVQQASITPPIPTTIPVTGTITLPLAIPCGGTITFDDGRSGYGHVVLTMQYYELPNGNLEVAGVNSNGLMPDSIFTGTLYPQN